MGGAPSSPLFDSQLFCRLKRYSAFLKVYLHEKKEKERQKLDGGSPRKWASCTRGRSILCHRRVLAVQQQGAESHSGAFHAPKTVLSKKGHTKACGPSNVSWQSSRERSPAPILDSHSDGPCAVTNRQHSNAAEGSQLTEMRDGRVSKPASSFGRIGCLHRPAPTQSRLSFLHHSRRPLAVWLIRAKGG
jgi:hypothetical protein